MTDNSRREFIQLAGGTGAVALAGCLGDDDGEDDVVLTMGTSSDGSSSWTIGQAMQAEVERNSDRITVAAQRTDGYASNIGLMADGDVDIVMVFNNMYPDAIQGTGIYEGQQYSVEELGWQGMGILSGEYIMVTSEDSDIETYSDLEGADVATYPTGTGIQPVFHNFLENAVGLDPDEDMNRLDLDYTDYASALEDGRVDACGFFTHNFGSVWSGTWQELSARNDIKPLQLEDVESAQEAFGTQFEVVEMPVVGEREPGFQGVDVPAVQLTAFMLIDQDVPADVWREVTEIWYDNSDALQEAASIMWDIREEENFTAGIFEEYPVHPGVEEFLQEQNWWNDDWTVGGE